MNCPHCQREIAENSNFCYFCGARQPNQPQAVSGPRVRDKRLMRSSTDVKIAGVCAGVAEYFEVDSTVVRLIWLLLVFFPVPFVPAILGYFVGWFVMPRAPLPQPIAEHANEPSPRTA